VTTPTLWLVAGADRVADAAATRRFRARISAPTHYCEFEGFEHEVFNELERHLVMERMGRFVDELFPV